MFQGNLKNTKVDEQENERIIKVHGVNLGTCEVIVILHIDQCLICGTNTAH